MIPNILHNSEDTFYCLYCFVNLANLCIPHLYKEKASLYWCLPSSIHTLYTRTTHTHIIPTYTRALDTHTVLHTHLKEREIVSECE